MHLKSLTLRGFKSFADKTALTFEPGITVIVGPNGSGKSNVVDALTWVLGSSSAKNLRGGSMADVIFAGAPGRSPLGRAQVDISIDNADGSLPIEFSEVAVSRSIFASGESGYAINDAECRALDVAELLSDTGLGRENHTIVGQGRLDAILNAKPEDRRAFIEEAAGILKHRKRKERALRKLAQMEAHVERLTDLLRELRRNLRPLERQAEAARKHAELRRALQEVRVLRAVRELDALDRRWHSEAGARSDSDGRLSGLEVDLAAARRRESELERELATLTPAVRGAGETHFRLANLVERYRGLEDRITERRAGLLEAVEEPVAGRDPAELRARAGEQRTALAAIAEEVDAARVSHAAAEEARRAAEQRRRAHEQAAAAEARRRALAREQQLRWEGEVAALRSSLAQAASEEGRSASQVSGLRSRRAELRADLEAVTEELGCLEREAAAQVDGVAAAQRVVAAREEEADAAAREERDLERQRASLAARAEALRVASRPATEGVAALLEAAEAGELAGLRGPLTEQVHIREGMATALAAVLGHLAEAVVTESRDSAAAALAHAGGQATARVVLLPADATAAARASGSEAELDPELVPEPDPEQPVEPADELAAGLAARGARPAVEALTAPAEVSAALGRALRGVYTVADLETACRLAASHPDCTFVSAAGEVAGPRGYAGGAGEASSAVQARAAAEEAEAALEAVEGELPGSRRRLEVAEEALAGARAELAAATAALQDLRASTKGAAERRSRLAKELGACDRELEAFLGQSRDLAREIAGQRDRLAALEARGADIAERAAESDSEGPDLEAERLEDALADAREREVQARLAAGALEQRGEELRRQVAAFEREADDVQRQLAERERRRVRRLAGIERCAELAVVAADALRRAEASLAVAAAERDRLEAARGACQQELGAGRARIRALGEELAALRDARHAEDLRRAQLRHALEAVRTRLVEELGVAAPEQLLQRARAGALDEAGELQPAPLEGGPERDAELAEHEERLVRKLGLLGTVNPLALEELAALEERHRFLAEQLDDLRSSREDLLQVVEAVDARIREVFAAAYADVAGHFARIFPRLFPGGEGRLVLTDPDDMLATGVEVEARPAGKRVKRLSLLSGGERSLTALAVLFAIFAARPSPFYVLDEVEAALDDVNLQRFLDVVKDFRSSSQLIIVTHQKRTMEIADTLYGVTMRGDGVSKVISQRIHERVPSAAG